MNTFIYTAFDSKGKLFRGNIEEKTWTQALRRVREMGLFPTSVKEQPTRALGERFKLLPRRRAASPRTSDSLRGGRIPAKVMTAFTRQLSTLLEAGLPLLRGLRSIQDQEENKRLRAIVGDLIKEIEGGAMLSEALAKHPRVFNRLYINMAVAGETAGMLESTLARLAEFMERSNRIRTRIKSALIYPAAVMFMAFGILSALTVFVIPRFKEVFSELTGSRSLPAFTEFVLNSSDFFKRHLLIFVAAVAAVVITFKFLNRIPQGRTAIDRAKLRLPVLGRIIRKVAIARFARTLGTMLQNGVPVLQALTIARDTTSNVVFARAIQHIHDRVKDGDTIASPLQRAGVFPSTVVSMIDIGEQTGALPNMLLKVADNYEEEVDASIAAALSLLEPALIIFLAVIVGSIVIALFLPIAGMIGGEGINPDRGME